MLLRNLMGTPQLSPAGAAKIVNIDSGSYTAGGVNTETRKLQVPDFLTPASEVTNAQLKVVRDAYKGVERGVFMEDTQEGPTKGFLYLLAAGKTEGELETIDILGGGTHLLPASLGIQSDQSLEDFVKQHSGALPARFKVHMDDIRTIMPSASRYERLSHPGIFSDPQVAATVINYYQAQAIAQLMSGEGLTEQLFGLSGAHHVDLTNGAQWGLLALEGILDYMTKSGQLLDESGEKLRAHDLGGIVPPTDYEALENGILPNTVWNWVKDLRSPTSYIRTIRGGSWNNNDQWNDQWSLHSAYRGSYDPNDARNVVGLRVAVSPQ